MVASETSDTLAGQDIDHSAVKGWTSGLAQHHTGVTNWLQLGRPRAVQC